MVFEDMTGKRASGIVYAALVVALFSGFVIMSRIGLRTSLSLPDIAALRFGIGALVLSPIVLRHGLGGLRMRQAILLALLGGLGFALFAYAGFKLAPAAHGAVLLHGTLSLTTALIAWALSRDLPRGPRAAGLCVIAAGILSMAWDGLRSAVPSLLLGDASLLLASFCWSGYGLYARHLGISATRAAGVVAVISAAIFLPAYAFVPGKALMSAPWRDLLVQGLFQGLLIGALSIFVYTRAVMLLGATEVSLFTASVPVVTTLAALVILHEWPNMPTILGVAAVTIGMLIALRSRP